MADLLFTNIIETLTPSVLSAITGWDFSQFLQDYFFGTKLLPIEPYLFFDMANWAIEKSNYYDAKAYFTTAHEKATDLWLKT
jgi:hypothetical protein